MKDIKETLKKGINDNIPLFDIVENCKQYTSKSLKLILVELDNDYSQEDLKKYFYTNLTSLIKNKSLRLDSDVMSETLFCKIYFKQSKKSVCEVAPMLDKVINDVVNLINEDMKNGVLKPVPNGEVYLLKEIKNAIDKKIDLIFFFIEYKNKYPNKYFAKNFFRVIEYEIPRDTLIEYLKYMIKELIKNAYNNNEFISLSIVFEKIFGRALKGKDWLVDREVYNVVEDVLESLSVEFNNEVKEEFKIV